MVLTWRSLVKFVTQMACFLEMFDRNSFLIELTQKVKQETSFRNVAKMKCIFRFAFLMVRITERCHLFDILQQAQNNRFWNGQYKILIKITECDILQTRSGLLNVTHPLSTVLSINDCKTKIKNKFWPKYMVSTNIKNPHAIAFQKCLSPLLLNMFRYSSI